MKLKDVGAVAMMSVGLLGVSTMAHALTTEVRIVSAFAYYDEANAVEVDPDSGWWAGGRGTGTVEIGSAYGAPDGLGREAVMLDTPTADDSVQVYARTDQPSYRGAFPEMLRATPDTQLGFWLYLSSASTTTASPVISVWIGVGSGGWRYEIVTFDPVANSYDQKDTWMYVDLTAADAVWTVSRAWPAGPADQNMTWDEIVDYTRTTYNGADSWGAFEYGLSFDQDTPGVFSAIDGVTAATTTWSTVTDFELARTSGRPVLDDCKNGGWQTHPAGTFKNQGACIAAIVAAN